MASIQVFTGGEEREAVGIWERGLGADDLPPRLLAQNVSPHCTEKLAAAQCWRVYAAFRPGGVIYDGGIEAHSVYSAGPELIGPDPYPQFNYEQIMRLAKVSSSGTQWHKPNQISCARWNSLPQNESP